MGDTTIVVDTSARADSTQPSGAMDADPVPPPIDGVSPPAGATAASVTSDLEALRAMSMAIPVAGVTAKQLIDSFDDKRGGSRTHNALDIMAARNTPAVAATSGKILKLHSSVAGGLTIYMTDQASRFIMMYGHLDSYRPGLKEGAAVRRGETIGFVGTTGNASTLAPHLHFQIMRRDDPDAWWRGTPINPFLVYRPEG